MKIQRYAPTLTVKTTDNGVEYPYADMRESMDGNFHKRSDILPLLNPWRDADKEKPKNYELVLLKLDDDCILFSVGNWHEDRWIVNDEFYFNQKIIAWMHIPKNEGEK